MIHYYITITLQHHITVFHIFYLGTVGIMQIHYICTGLYIDTINNIH